MTWFVKEMLNKSSSFAKTSQNIALPKSPKKLLADIANNKVFSSVAFHSVLESFLQDLGFHIRTLNLNRAKI